MVIIMKRVGAEIFENLTIKLLQPLIPIRSI